MAVTRTVDSSSCGSWAAPELPSIGLLQDRGPRAELNIRILQSGSKVQDKGGFQKPCFVGRQRLSDFVGP